MIYTYDLYVPVLRNCYLVNKESNILSTKKTFNLQTKLIINYLFISIKLFNSNSS